MAEWLKQFFVREEPDGYRVKFGTTIASGLAGFVAGVVFASIIWGLLLYYLEVLYVQ